MAERKLHVLLKEARTAAGLTQTALAAKVDGLTANDISKAERGEAVPTQAQLKQIAKACGVTQSSLLYAPTAKVASTSSSAKKPSTSTAKKPASTSSAKKPASSSSSSQLKLTAAEKTLVQLYRKADDATKEEVIKLLNKKSEENGGADLSGLLQNVLGNVVSSLIGREVPDNEE